MTIQVDIVLLAFHSAKWIEPCMNALRRIEFPTRDIRIVFVDNASSDNSVGVFKKWIDADQEETEGETGTFADVIVHETGGNRGCAGGNNIGWRLGDAPFVLFLNLDTEVEPDFLGPLVQAMEGDGTIGFTGPKIYFPDSKKLQHAGGMIYDNGMSDHYYNTEEDEGQADDRREVDFLTGACLMARRKTLEELNGLDEDFNPAYFEETDLCYRAAKAGWKSYYIPESLIYHFETAGLGGRASPRFLQAIYRNRMRFVVKHWTLADMFEKWLPTERWWFGIIESKEARPYQIRSYLQAIGFLISKQFRR